MSAISSVSSGAQFSLLQQLQQRNATGSSTRADFQKQRQADFATALQAAGVDSSKVGDIQSQIDAAVQGVQQSGTSSRDAIKTAVDNVLQKNGVDLTKFQEALKATHKGHGPHGAPPPKAGGDGDGDADDGGSASGVNGSSESSGANALQTKLADLLKALANGTTQQSDLAAGSLVDVAA